MVDDKFLGLNGLSHYHEKNKEYISESIADMAVINKEDNEEVEIVEDVSDCIVSFTEADVAQSIPSGEKLSVLFGMISKWWNTLNESAFYSVANSVTTSESGLSVLDAYQGKILQDQITTNTSSIDTLNSKIIVETVAATINESADYAYIPPKDGYHLVSAVNESYTDSTDIPIGITWHEYFYVVFFKSASAEATTKNLVLTWVKLD